MFDVLDWHLPAAILIPLLATPLIFLLSERPRLRDGLTLITSVLLFANVAVIVTAVMDGARPEFQIVEFLPGLELTLSAEPLGALFAAIASFLWIINSIYGIGYMRANSEPNQGIFFACFAVSLACTMGIAFADNLLVLFIGYESLSLVTYPLVIHRRNADARRAGREYLALLMGASIILLLLAVFATWALTGTLDFRPGGILAGHADGGTLGVMLMLFAYGAAKAGIMPLHRWLPTAMIAPTPVSALLHAVAVVKAGVFTIVKVVVFIFGIDLLRGADWSVWLSYVAGFTVIAASVIAIYQDNLKRRLAYSTISQLSYVVLAASIYTPIAIVGATLHIAAHAFGKITLFFAAGSIYTASGKTRVSELDGIGRRLPWTLGAFAIGALSMIGLPPTIGFISKWYILVAAYSAQEWFALTVLVLSTVLNAMYYLPIVYVAFFREPDENTALLSESRRSVWIPPCFTAAMTLLLFIYPEPLIRLASSVGLNP